MVAVGPIARECVVSRHSFGPTRHRRHRLFDLGPFACTFDPSPTDVEVVRMMEGTDVTRVVLPMEKVVSIVEVVLVLIVVDLWELSDLVDWWLSCWIDSEIDP